MAQYATDADLQEYEPDILNLGIPTYKDLHEKSFDDINRLIEIDWWPRASYRQYDITRGTYANINVDLLVDSQWKRVAVYHVLAYYIYPRLSTFTPEGDVYMEKMQYYKDRFKEEFDLCLKQGVQYDYNNDSTIEESEKLPVHFNRLVR